MVAHNNKSDSREDTGDLFSHIQALLEYKWQVFGVALVAVVIAALVVYTEQPVYRATNSLVIEYRQANVLGVDEVYETGAGANTYYATQVTILGSRDMAEKAVDRIDWEKYPDFLTPPKTLKARFFVGLVNVLPVLQPYLGKANTDPAEVTEEMLRQARISMFSASARIEPVATTQIVKIHFLSPSPALAAEAANALAEAYIESGFEAQFEATRRATQWLNERLSGVKDRLAESESALQNFREKQDIVNVGGGRGILESELSDNLQRLRDAERVKAQLQNTYSQIRQAGGLPQLLQQIPVLIEDDLVRSTKQGFLIAEREASEFRLRYGPKHPTMIKAEVSLREARTAFHQQLMRAAEGVRSRYEVAEKNVRTLSQVADKTRSQIRDLDRQDYSMQVLARDADANAQLYDTILKRFKEADVAGDFQNLKARVIDRAMVPTRPFLPNKRRALLFAGFFGALLGAALAIVRNHLDTGLKSGDELERVSGKPVFASVPDTGRSLLRGGVAKLVETKPKSSFAEGIRTIRTGILLSDLDSKKKRVLVTSALPQEGKSSIATNLALAFSQVEKVLLIDGDLRKPSLSKYLGLKSNSVGLSELLHGEVERKSAAIHQIAPNVDLLPVGRQLPSPGQVLTSKRFGELLDELSKDYDRVIIDSSPCQPVSDTLLLAKYVDGMVYVARFDSTGVKTVQTAVKRLDKSGTPILGTVLNRVNHRRALSAGDSYYYGEGYYN